MKLPEFPPELEKKDYWLALILAIIALAAYVRTLAPDVLYSDSAEFQTLAYTFGLTHSTGYPTYLLLGRLVGLLPIHSPAWRISLLSAITAAITVGGIYLLACYFTRSRVGAVLGAVALAISYTFWSQAVIAEVYTSGTAFIALITLFLFRWQIEPAKRTMALLVAALLAGIGFGVHASVWLVAPPAVALVLWTLWCQHASRTVWLRALLSGLIGAVTGLMIFVITFFIAYRVDPSSSFVRTTLEPSRVFWNLQPGDFKSPLKVLEITVFSAQWGDALFPGESLSFGDELSNFIGRLAELEFSPLMIVFMLAGMVIMSVKQPIRGLFPPLTFLVSLFFILNYQVGDKYVFYLSLYIPLTVALGTGIGFVLEWIQRLLNSIPDRRYHLIYLLPVMFFVTLVVLPTAAARWSALQVGKADFVTDTYPYPVADLREPRFVAESRLVNAEPNSVFVLDWRALFTTAYIAQVENHQMNMLFMEAMPVGNNGMVASTLIDELKGYLQEGRSVFTNQRYPGLDQDFRLVPGPGDLYTLKLKP